jgi:hypothetical protein
MASLIELSEEILDLEIALESAENLEAREALIKSYFDAVGDRNVKIDSYAALIRELELRSEARKSEGERLLARSKTDNNKAQYLKERLMMVFKYFQLTSVETPRFRVSLATNGGKLPVIISCPIENLPSEYVKQIVTLKANLDLIAEELEAGVLIENVCFGERGEGIRIK